LPQRAFLPLWLLSDALGNRPLPEATKATDAEAIPERPTLIADRERVHEDLRDRLQPLQDAHAILHWVSRLEAPRRWRVTLTALDETEENFCLYQAVRDDGPELPTDGTEVVLLGKRRRYQLALDPSSAETWTLYGPRTEQRQVELEEYRDDRHRVARQLVESLRPPITRTSLAAAATQVPLSMTHGMANRECVATLPGEKAWEDRQWQALQLAWQELPCVAIKGPPGTGKSTVIVGLIRRAVRAGKRVLLVAPAHVAIDVVLKRLDELAKNGLEHDVFAARVAPRDEGKIDPILREYVPQRRAAHILDRASSATKSRVAAKTDRVQHLEASIASLNERRARLMQLADVRMAAAQVFSDLELALGMRDEVALRKARLESELEDQRRKVASAEDEEQRTRPTGFGSRFREFFTRTNSHARAALRALLEGQENLAAQLQECDAELRIIIEKLRAAEARRADFKHAVIAVERGFESAGEPLPIDPA
jgi:hypothetical protein